MRVDPRALVAAVGVLAGVQLVVQAAAPRVALQPRQGVAMRVECFAHTAGLAEALPGVAMRARVAAEPAAPKPPLEPEEFA